MFALHLSPFRLHVSLVLLGVGGFFNRNTNHGRAGDSVISVISFISSERCNPASRALAFFTKIYRLFDCMWS